MESSVISGLSHSLKKTSWLAMTAYVCHYAASVYFRRLRTFKATGFAQVRIDSPEFGTLIL
jgi:hypothetical protein